MRQPCDRRACGEGQRPDLAQLPELGVESGTAIRQQVGKGLWIRQFEGRNQDSGGDCSGRPLISPVGPFVLRPAHFRLQGTHELTSCHVLGALQVRHDHAIATADGQTHGAA